MTENSAASAVPDFAAILETTEALARSAGEILCRAYHQPRQIEYKGEVNLVTQADLASEKYIVSALQEAFPTHTVVAEEGSEHNGKSGLTWLIDPLDGTTNFAHGFPVFAVSMALRNAEQVLVGIVYDPIRDECFAAARGRGATLNGKPIRVSGTPGMGQSLLATGFPYDRQTADDNNVMALGAFIRRCQGIRRAGSAALDLVYVACGRLDGYWEMRMQPWDIAAGMLLVREAGGKATSYQGTEHDDAILTGGKIVASNGLFHDEMLAVLRDTKK
ncbi:MAG: inositol monophosphatase [Anaerolineae bacterium]|nr:inositol monophosphatase [Anaerolineae bacterium]